MPKGPAPLFLLLFVAAGCQQTGAPPSPPTKAEKAPTPPSEPATCSDCVPVTAENFPRAESDLYFGVSVKQAGGIGKFYHYREAMPIDKQTVIRANRDTLYSAAVFDLDAGPVTITLPDSGKRFMAMQVIGRLLVDRRTF
jgi:Protein of unknown function (DUF1254)